MRILVSGSSGLIGSALLPRLLEDGHEVTRLVRRTPGYGEVMWDPAAGAIDAPRLEGHDAVIHLAGEGLGTRRWSAEQKRRIYDSRVEGTRLLCEALAGLAHRPAVLLSASAIGYYGHRGDEPLNEESSGGSGFLADVVRDWEAATAAAEGAGIRVAHLRTGLVMTPEGGSLGEMLPIFRLGLGGRLGSGRQYWSWITIDDEVEATLHCLSHDEVRGPVNLVGPNPVTNAEFTKTLGRVLRRPAVLFVPRPALAVRFGSEMADDMLLAGQRVLPAKLEATGFRFRHPDLEPALREVLGKD